MICDSNARLKVLSVDVETVSLLKSMSEHGSPYQIAANELERELRNEIETLKKLFSDNRSNPSVGREDA